MKRLAIILPAVISIAVVALVLSTQSKDSEPTRAATAKETTTTSTTLPALDEQFLDATFANPFVSNLDYTAYGDDKLIEVGHAYCTYLETSDGSELGNIRAITFLAPYFTDVKTLDGRPSKTGADVLTGAIGNSARQTYCPEYSELKQVIS